MPIVLRPDHPLAAELASPPVADARALRIGIINIMPRIEAYEPSLLRPLAKSPQLVEPVFIRLQTHGYQSSDHEHLDRFYRSFDAVWAEAPLDGIILTGAPVEELAFDEVRYFPELRQILEFARGHVPSTLGLCWGGLALGHLVGVEKILFPKKLFGVFENRALVEKHPYLDGGAFSCAHSRHSGVADSALESAAQAERVRLLSWGPETGYSLFETPDHRYLAHLGHPEYEAERLRFEWDRDRQLARPDVDPPRNFDVDAPSTTTWAGHRQALIDGWLAYLAASR